MVQARLRLPDGTAVRIEGRTREVAALLDSFARAGNGHRSNGTGATRRPARSAGHVSPRGAGPTTDIRDLKAERFFGTKRTIADVQRRLAQRGRRYAVTNLSPALLRLVRAGTLRRAKEAGVFRYRAP